MTRREYIEARSIPIPFAGCWLWLRSVGSHGYGQGTGGGQRVTVAHRLSYEAFKGPIPTGMLVQHSCDNKWCVNPDHLSIGTDATNAIDKQKKGRAAKKLTAEQARGALAGVGTHQSIADNIGISKSMVQRIRAGLAWTHVRDGVLVTAFPLSDIKVQP